MSREEDIPIRRSGAPIDQAAGNLAQTLLGNQIVSEGAHEVRSQLAVILLELGKIDHLAARRIEEDVQAASETVNRIAMLYRLTRTTMLDMAPIDIATLARQAVEAIRIKLPGHDFALEIVDASSGTASIPGHRAFLSEAIRGLLDNVMRHTSPGTRTVLRCEPNTISVDDDGPGLPLAVAKRFAEPFVHGRRPNAGVGLGLAIAHQIGRLHGGDCRPAPSRLGGTCVRLTLSATPTHRPPPGPQA
jgi:signal transduction histidine kinase